MGSKPLATESLTSNDTSCRRSWSWARRPESHCVHSQETSGCGWPRVARTDGSTCTIRSARSCLKSRSADRHAESDATSASCASASVDVQSTGSSSNRRTAVCKIRTAPLRVAPSATLVEAAMKVVRRRDPYGSPHRCDGRNTSLAYRPVRCSGYLWATKCFLHYSLMNPHGSAVVVSVYHYW